MSRLSPKTQVLTCLFCPMSKEKSPSGGLSFQHKNPIFVLEDLPKVFLAILIIYHYGTTMSCLDMFVFDKDACFGQH